MLNVNVWMMFRYQERFIPGGESGTPRMQSPAPQLEGKSPSFISRFMSSLAGGGGSKSIGALRVPSQQSNDGSGSGGRGSPVGKSGQVDDEAKSQV